MFGWFREGVEEAPGISYVAVHRGFEFGEIAGLGFFQNLKNAFREMNAPKTFNMIHCEYEETAGVYGWY